MPRALTGVQGVALVGAPFELGARFPHVSGARAIGILGAEGLQAWLAAVRRRLALATGVMAECGGNRRLARADRAWWA